LSSGWRKEVVAQVPLPLRQLLNWFSTIWERTSAVRPEELLEILRDLAVAGSPPSIAESQLQETAARVIASLQFSTPETMEAIAAMREALPKLAETQGRAVIANFNAATDVALANLEGWFNVAQDRAKQWFAIHTRIITVFCAVVAAFALQLDSFKLIQRVSSDPEVRSRLLAAAPALAKQAQEVFDAASPFSQSTHTNAVATLVKTWPGITNVVLPTNVVSIAQRDEIVRRQLASSFPSNQVEKVFSDYTNAINNLALNNVKDWSQRFGTINEQLSSTGIELVPQPYPGLFSPSWFGPRRHLLGMLASAALLSLGAPFWFNLLKSLTNLRPALAQQVEKNPRAGVISPS
jgi:hypothetical protein